MNAILTAQAILTMLTSCLPSCYRKAKEVVSATLVSSEAYSVALEENLELAHRQEKRVVRSSKL